MRLYAYIRMVHTSSSRFARLQTHNPTTPASSSPRMAALSCPLPPSICTYVCMYVLDSYMHTHMDSYMYIHTDSYMHIHIDSYMYVHIGSYMCIHIDSCTGYFHTHHD